MNRQVTPIISSVKRKLTIGRQRTDLVTGLVRFGLFSGGGAFEADVSSLEVHHAALNRVRGIEKDHRPAMIAISGGFSSEREIQRAREIQSEH